MTTETSCAHHPRRESLAQCYHCQASICGGCHNVDLLGRAICAPCLEARVVPTIPWETTDSLSSAFSGALETWWQVLRHPRRFWQSYRASTHWVFPSLFAVASIALGLFFSSFWQRQLSPDYADHLLRLQDTIGLSIPALEFLLVASLPLTALILFGIHSLSLLFSLRLFQIQRATWTDVAQISGYSCAAFLWLIIPPIADFGLGQFMLILWLFNLEVTALRLRYRLGFWTSILIVFPPLLLLLLFVG